MAFKSISHSSFPDTFHQDILTVVAKLLKKGESIQLVGSRGSGKSTLVRLLTQIPRIRNRYLSANSGFRFVVLDARLLLERNSLTLTRLLLSLFGPEEKEIPNDNVVVNKELVEQIEKSISKGHLVIIIDHINEVNFPEHKSFFASLSFIHNKFRSKVSFIFISERPLLTHKDLENFGYLGKVLTANVVVIPPLNKKDSMWFANDVLKQENIDLEKSKKEKIIDISGGYPRTIRRVVEALGAGYTLEELLANPSIHPALAFHLEELSVDGVPRVKNQILESYLMREQLITSGEKIGEFNMETKLTKIEEKVFKLFTFNIGKILEREEVISTVWGPNSLEISDHAYDQIIHRLRNKLKNTKPKVEIETIKGRGHSLKVGNSH